MYASFWSKHISELRNPYQPVERHEVCLSSRERALKNTTGSVLQPRFMADPHITMLCPDNFAIPYPRMMRTGFATMGPKPSAAKTSTSTSTRSSSAHDRRSQTLSAAIKELAELRSPTHRAKSIEQLRMFVMFVSTTLEPASGSTEGQSPKKRMFGYHESLIFWV